MATLSATNAFVGQRVVVAKTAQQARRPNREPCTPPSCHLFFFSSPTRLPKPHPHRKLEPRPPSVRVYPADASGGDPRYGVASCGRRRRAAGWERSSGREWEATVRGVLRFLLNSSLLALQPCDIFASPVKDLVPKPTSIGLVNSTCWILSCYVYDPPHSAAPRPSARCAQPPPEALPRSELFSWHQRTVTNNRGESWLECKASLPLALPPPPHTHTH
jgi:hypothetical protein